MNDLRISYAKLLQDNITNELKDLEMKDSVFSVKIDFDAMRDSDGIYNFKDTGLNKVEFFISTNKGQKEKQLTKIASGGEMSRIMLAIKSIISDKDNFESLIFDEIDTGISGIAAQKVGQKLSNLAKSHQLICITHLPQIAVMADNHYMIEKNTKDDLTKTNVKRLGQNETIHEIARIIGGATISDITLQNAREMLENARGN
jgi:DNA repair protein RecN (Recombination protein N)